MLKIGIWIAVALSAGGAASSAAGQTPIPPSAANFAMSAAQSDQYEIDAAEDAVVQSHNPTVRAFAQQMIQDHTHAEAAVREAAVASGLPAPPPAISTDQAHLLASLQSLRGPNFDQAYAHQQVLAHQEALTVEQSYAAAGTDADLRKAAQADIPMIRRHLQLAQQMAAAVGGS
jgi:putative membrane protein